MGSKKNDEDKINLYHSVGNGRFNRLSQKEQERLLSSLDPAASADFNILGGLKDFTRWLDGHGRSGAAKIVEAMNPRQKRVVDEMVRGVMISDWHPNDGEDRGFIAEPAKTLRVKGILFAPPRNMDDESELFGFSHELFHANAKFRGMDLDEPGGGKLKSAQAEFEGGLLARNADVQEIRFAGIRLYAKVVREAGWFTPQTHHAELRADASAVALLDAGGGSKFLDLAKRLRSGAAGSGDYEHAVLESLERIDFKSVKFETLSELNESLAPRVGEAWRASLSKVGSGTLLEKSFEARACLSRFRKDDGRSLGQALEELERCASSSKVSAP